MGNITIKSAMHLKSEPDDFYLLREEGQQAYNFVHFLSPVIVVIDGYEYTVNKDACVIYTPKARQEYHAMSVGFTNNFVTFTADEPNFIDQFNLPKNQIFYTRHGKQITDIVEYITWAIRDIQLDHDGDLLDKLYLLFQTLSENMIEDSAKNQRLFQTRKRFIDMRNEIRAAPKDWTVDRMAKTVYLTRSRFTVLYKEFFGLSPGDDLIVMTISYAKQMLIDTNYSINEIAQRCGYDSVEHFIRLFKKRTGMTPGKYKSNRRHYTPS